MHLAVTWNVLHTRPKCYRSESLLMEHVWQLRTLRVCAFTHGSLPSVYARATLRNKPVNMGHTHFNYFGAANKNGTSLTRTNNLTLNL